MKRVMRQQHSRLGQWAIYLEQIERVRPHLGELGAWLFAWRRQRGTGVRRCFLCPLAACPVRVPADVANEVLVAIGNVLAQRRQPLRTRHHLEVPLRPEMHLKTRRSPHAFHNSREGPESLVSQAQRTGVHQAREGNGSRLAFVGIHGGKTPAFLPTR